jgi:hypothetical protein
MELVATKCHSPTLLLIFLIPSFCHFFLHLSITITTTGCQETELKGTQRKSFFAKMVIIYLAKYV